MSGVYKVESQHVLSIKSKTNVCIVAWPRKNIKLDAGFWGCLWTCPMTIKWDAEHPDSNTCAEQWHYNVDFRLNNDRCSSDDFLNRDDGSIDMIVYKVEGPRSNLGGISSISSMGNPKDFEWLRNRTKPTARQISISKSLTESMVKQNLCWTGHFIPPPPTENASIKWPVQVKPLKKHMFTWNGHFIPQPVGSRTLTRKRNRPCACPSWMRFVMKNVHWHL